MSRSQEDITRIERHAALAWPAPVSQRADGWLLRHTPRMRRLRASGAALPLARAGRLCSSLRRVETFYADRDVPAAIQVTPASERRELDQHLAARGYAFRVPIQVLTAPPDALTSPSPRDPGWDVEVRDTPTTAWLNAFAELDGEDDSMHVAEQVVAQISLPTGYADISVDNRIVGVGLVVGGDDQWAGVYCMATHPDYRRQGVGAAVLRSAARWAVDHGAGGLYLQVTRANEAAQRTYARAGFSHAYDYHYRVASRTDS